MHVCACTAGTAVDVRVNTELTCWFALMCRLQLQGRSVLETVVPRDSGLLMENDDPNDHVRLERLKSAIAAQLDVAWGREISHEAMADAMRLLVLRVNALNSARSLQH